MADYINKNKLKDALKNLYRYESFPIADIEQLFDSIPVMDMEFVKHGHWEAVEYNDGTVRTECSVCGYGRGLPPVRNYCPNCGAKMDEVE